MDTLKKVLLFLATGLSVIVLYLLYLLATDYETFLRWHMDANIEAVEAPCALIHLRRDTYLVSIILPVPANAPANVTRWATSFWIDAEPSADQPLVVTPYCAALVAAINSNAAETVLAPFKPEAKSP